WAPEAWPAPGVPHDGVRVWVAVGFLPTASRRASRRAGSSIPTLVLPCLTLHGASRQALHYETLPDKVQDAYRDGRQHGTGHELAPDVLIADHHHGEFYGHRHGALIHGDDEGQ